MLESNAGMLSFGADRHYELYPRQRSFLTFQHTRGRQIGLGDLTVSNPTNPNQHAWKFWRISFAMVHYGIAPTEQQLQDQRDRVAARRQAIAKKRQELAATHPTREQVEAIFNEEFNVSAMQNVRAGWMWQVRFPTWVVLALAMVLPVCWCGGFLVRLR